MNTTAHNTGLQSASEEIIAALKSLRRRGRAVLLTAGLSWTVAILCILATGFLSALGWWGGDIVRLIGWGTCVLTLGVVVLVSIIRPLGKFSSLLSTARQIGAALPEYRSSILSAGELSTDRNTQRFSSALLSGHLGQVRNLLASTPGGRIFPVKPLLPSGAALIAAVAIALTAYTFKPGVIQSGITSLFGEPSVLAGSVSTTQDTAPAVADLTITLIYPAYLDRSPRTLESISGGIGTPLGTTALLTGRSLFESPTQAHIELPEGQQARLDIQTDGKISGRFVVRSGGEFRFVLGDERSLIRGPARNLDVEMDAPPSVRITRPTSSTTIDENSSLAIDFDAEDDHGIDRIDLVIRVGEDAEIRKTVTRTAKNVDQLRSRFVWTPGNLKFEDSPKVSIYLEAFDNDTIRGPKPGKSAPISVTVMTAGTRHQLALQKQIAILDRLLDLLAARLETRPPASPKHEDKALERFTEIRGMTEDLLGATAKLIHRLKKDPLSPRSVTVTLMQIREDLSNQVLHEAGLHRKPMANFKSRQGVDRVTLRILETAIVRMDDLILDQQFAKLVGRGESLGRDRKGLANLLLRYKEAPSESTRRAILDTVKRMEETVAKLNAQLEKIRGQVSYSHMNTSSKNSLDLTRDLQRLRELLAGNEIEKASDLAERLERQLARLMTGLESGRLTFRTERFSEGEQFIGELLDRILTLEADQIQLRRRSTATLRRYQEKLQELMSKQIDHLVAKQQRRAKAMSGFLDKMSDSSSMRTRETVTSAKVLLRDLNLILGQGDLEEARQIVLDIEQLVGQIEAEGSDADRLDRVRKDAGDMAEEIASSYPGPSKIFNAADRRKTRNQSAKQRHLNARTKKLRMWIKDQEKETKFLGHQALVSLDRVTDHMGRSIRHLEERSVRAAVEAQTMALDELSRLREDLRRGNEGALLESRPVVIMGEVSIPAPDDFKVPKEFRQDILEAMRGKQPDSYKEAIEKYYEKLVR